MITAYYNENDKFAAEWLRELIKGGHITDGEVDERSIEDVTPSDLRGFTRCHFFAGIACWDLALNHAGWGDEPIWTGSAPCQPFSQAGKGAGFADERHLWPSWFWLIRQSSPQLLAGEQVEGPAGAAWFDSVSNDLEGEGYTCGQVVFPAAGVGAPHIRSRRYWMAHHHHQRRDGREAGRGSAGRLIAPHDGLLGHHHHHQGLALGSEPAEQRGTLRHQGTAPGAAGALRDGLGDTSSAGPATQRGDDGQVPGLSETQRESELRAALSGRPSETVRTLVDTASEQEGIPGRAWLSGGSSSVDGALALADGGDAGAEGLQRSGQHRFESQDGGAGDGLGDTGSSGSRRDGGTVPGAQGEGDRERLVDGRQSHEPFASGHAIGDSWRHVEWIACRDGKLRPIESRHVKMVDGTALRLGRSGMSDSEIEQAIEKMTFPLSTGEKNRVGRLRGYGNGLCKDQAQVFIEEAMTWLLCGDLVA